MSVPAAENPVADVSHGIAAVLPFLYIAWADGLLTPTQVEQIRSHIDRQAWLTEADRETLGGWLDPQNPPSAETYYGWVRAIKRAAAHIPEADRKSLAELGCEIANLAGVSPDTYSTPEAQEALAEIETVLGIVGKEAVRELVRVRPEGDGMPAEAEVSVSEAAAPDTEVLKALLDGDRAPLRERVRTLLRDPAFAYPEEPPTKEEYREVVFRWTKLLAEQGLGALAYPEYAGGEDDMEGFVAAFETIAYHDLNLAIKFGVQFGLWGGSINGLGSEEQRRQYLRDVGTLDLPGCFAMTEKRHGSNVRDLQTTATYDPQTESFVIQTPTPDDHKEWIGNAATHGRMATVFAQLVLDDYSHGVHAFIVAIHDDEGDPMPGVTIGDSGYKLGLNGVDNGRLWFDSVRIPRENLLSRFAEVSPEGAYTSPIPSSSKRFFTMLGTLVGGRIAVAGAGVSAGKSALTIAVRYAERRRQFGPKDGPEVAIMDYLTHQRRLLPFVATSYGLTFALHDLAHRYQHIPRGEDVRAIEAEAAALKVMGTWHGTAAIQTSREAMGGEGYRYSNRFASLKADSDIFTTFEGDNTVLALQVAKTLLSGYKEEFQNLDFFGLLGKLRERVEVRIGEVNPLTRRRSSESHLRDFGLHADLFHSRERDLLISAARRLKGRMDEGMDSFQAFIEVQDHLVTLGLAHAQRLVLDAFQAAVDATPEGPERDVLETLATLYALWHIEEDRGWFLEQHYIDAPKSKAVRTEVNTLLGELRPHAVTLVNAFGIPDELLYAPVVLELETAS